ncbi:insecticidal delta-endotoxin Cry8Ea1 family protein [Bacillus cereus]|nr:insecticidal delta-endotoxin Cry8Ea1 family protein [Bacillus cereus]
MNCKNQNEFDIIDVTENDQTTVSQNIASNVNMQGSLANISSNYPLANNHNISLQNMNYKEYLRMSEGYGKDANSLEPVSVGRDAVFSALSITRIFLGFAGLGTIGGIVGLFSEALKWLWPNKTTDTWAVFIQEVEELINQKVTEAIVNKALAELKGLGDLIEEYIILLEKWEQNAPDLTIEELLRNKFINLNDFFIQNMPSFGVLGYEVPLLTVYAQAANLHLTVLRDADLLGKQWGMDSKVIEYYYDLQKRKTAEYSDYCVKWYNSGLDRLKGSDAMSWYNYNKFRREMTLMVLDIVALFPNHDARMYHMETTAELTRMVYTDPLGNMIYAKNEQDWRKAYGMSFDKIENECKQIGLFAWLNSIEIYTDKQGIKFHPDQSYNYWAGDITSTSYTNSSINIIDYHGNYRSSDKFIMNTKSKDIYQIISYPISYNLVNQSYYGIPKTYFNWVPMDQPTKAHTYLYSKPFSTIFHYHERNLEEELPPASTEPPQPNEYTYTHRLAYTSIIDAYYYNKPRMHQYGGIPLLGWTHRSVSHDNRIYTDKITQIPASKAANINGGMKMVKDPGFLGGDMLYMPPYNSTSATYVLTADSDIVSKSYYVRIRYASDRTNTLGISGGIYVNGQKVQDLSFAPFETLNYQEKPSKYNHFQLTSYYSNEIKIPSTKFELRLFGNGNTGNMYINKFEFIPKNMAYEIEQHLEIVKKSVSGLFTNTKEALQPGVTDYQIDQAANLIECVSAKGNGNDKQMLFDAVKVAKQLSKSRNLLQDVDFHTLNGSGNRENGWVGNTGISVVEGDSLFKNRSLRLQGARLFDTETFPTYLYQKIDESKLKPYTRYKLRGFIRSSQDLEVYLMRNDAKRAVMNVPEDLTSGITPTNAFGEVDRCLQQQSINAILQSVTSLPCGGMSSTSHQFSLTIDTGDLDYAGNPGITVALNIVSPDGYASLGNLELIEEGLLTGDDLTFAEQQNQQQQAKIKRKREETDTIYVRAKQAINNLFSDYQDQQLKYDVNISDIVSVDNILQLICDVNNKWIPAIRGMNYDTFTALKNRIQQAYNLYEARNAIQNGDFRNRLTGWDSTPNANVQSKGNSLVLVIPNWDSQVSQNVMVEPNRRYQLRVIAKKEGVGNGYVTLTDGTNCMETVTFSTYDTSALGLTDFVIKSVEILPQTNQLRVEIGETEGTFTVESVSLIRK